MALLDRPEKHTGGGRCRFQLQQYRLGHVVWLVNLERLAITNCIGRITGCHRIKPADHLAGKSTATTCQGGDFTNSLGRALIQVE